MAMVNGGKAYEIIRLVPCSPGAIHGFTHVTVVTTSRRGVPLHRANLARGPQQLVVIPDESHVRLEEEDWARLPPEVLSPGGLCFYRYELDRANLYR